MVDGERGVGGGRMGGEGRWGGGTLLVERHVLVGLKVVLWGVPRAAE